MNFSAGMTTISGHRKHSLNVSRGFSLPVTPTADPRDRTLQSRGLDRGAQTGAERGDQCTSLCL